MKSVLKVKTIILLLGIAIAVSPMLLAHNDRDRRDRDDRRERDNDTPLALIGVIPIPGNPIASTDIAWVDQATERLYLTDRNNGPVPATAIPGVKTHGAVDVIDAESDLFIGRITTGTINKSAVFFAGANSVDRNLGGPNGVAAGANLTVWAGDGDNTVKVADVNPKSKTYLQIIASVSLSGLTAVSNCVPSTCRRADELGYDPADKIMMVATDAPTTLPPFASFVSAVPPYNVIGQVNFAA